MATRRLRGLYSIQLPETRAAERLFARCEAIGKFLVSRKGIVLHENELVGEKVEELNNAHDVAVEILNPQIVAVVGEPIIDGFLSVPKRLCPDSGPQRFSPKSHE